MCTGARNRPGLQVPRIKYSKRGGRQEVLQVLLGIKAELNATVDFTS